MYVHHMGTCLIHKETSSRVSDPLKLELQVGGGEPSCRCWELKQGSLQEEHRALNSNLFPISIVLYLIFS